MTDDNVIPRADIVRQAVRLGAEIKNIKLSDDLSDQVVAVINRLLLEHKVIFLRDQGHLDDAEQQRFAIRLGSLAGHVATDENHGASLPRETASDHRTGYGAETLMDVSRGEPYPKISVLRGGVIPPYSGETVWSNPAAAYLDLPEPLRMLADDLWAVYRSARDHNVTGRTGEINKAEFGDVFTGTIRETANPVVRIHPDTGERMLVLGHFVQHFVGLQKHTSERLFNLLQSYLTAPENTVCWSWRSGDVAIWDNRTVELHDISKSGDQYRLMGRIAIDSDASPVAVGRRSAAQIKGSKPQVPKAA
ncbi:MULTISPECIES: TauD/TfdA dioxygenase family protein [unclassified Bradyrhizobium]